MTSRLLYTMPYSPWSERARWALLHHGIDFVEREHVPLLSELALRARAKRWGGGATVPLLLDGEVPVMDSFDIAVYSDSIGGGEKLIETSQRERIKQINEDVESLMHAVRAHLVQLGAKHDEVAVGMMPASLRKLPLAAASSRMGASFVARKHKASLSNVEERLRAGLRAIRAHVAGRAYVNDSFSYADIVCATPLEVVHPVADRFIPLTPGLRVHLHHPALATEFADLLKWRDQVYEKHRPVAPPR